MFGLDTQTHFFFSNLACNLMVLLLFARGAKGYRVFLTAVEVSCVT